ncbi:type I DNA topoisomerase [Candidatus Uhrbacteria bacterium CG_4_9_14_3_um_filter_41_35]|uniref:DNA topoisomerase 1 n=1 Tax=Candidatus Uhrbacteria bacterium CG_4_9_14_3_um_filter_41_35 TaxID=1975034 RepID=A0A2M7XG28_9BACT|nr:MAG: DNA topoisomerase I [Candidatus Uhrbacteria bacterium CG11_big_fil_rev_8_21_14_0_20_41_9]PJA46805.1 MAG: type I DNA topoisomerase [Candidatus Uhrbacteria bacterium CG_4_9_14_3_um_filter_41_35]
MVKLLIVESPTKARTITKFLGPGYIVTSSYGHLRDLPKKETGVDVQHDFEPTYIVPDDKKAKVTELKTAAKKADEIYLATDEDREGEAIAWHIAEILKIDPKTAKRITFHEITKTAIEEALQHPRTLAQDLINAQQARRILDRLVGYELSPFLWKKVRRGLSAGRVQSVAVRLIVDRERERQAFKQDEYWTIEGKFDKDELEFDGKLVERAGKKLKKLDISNEAEATQIVSDLAGAEFKIGAVTKKQSTRKPPTPLHTSVLQQEANNKLGMSAKQAMTLAQKLYETGKITYMRTDSLNLSEKFLSEAQTFISDKFGPDYAKGVVVYKTKSKGAQEAHEAIRPTDVLVTPESLEGTIDVGLWKLYDLIWRRTVASQLPPAKLDQTAIDIQAKEYIFRANGSTIAFDGFMKVYRSAKEKLLPNLAEGDPVNVKSILPNQHFTEPPARYSDATLIKALEENEIGRPSTYAPTISTIENRGYIERDDNKKLAPTDIAMIVTDLLVEHFSTIVNLEFTAKMEKSLDEVAEGKIDWVPMLREFYVPFHKNLEEKSEGLSREEIAPPRELGVDPKTEKTIYVRSGRFGSYIQVGDWTEEDRKAKVNKPKSVSLTRNMNMETVTLENALKLLELPRELGVNDEGEMITVLIGPYGPYMKAGKINVTLPEQYDPITIEAKDAVAIFKEGAELKKQMLKPLAELGEDPNSKKPIVIKTGRFGPYVTDGKTNVSIKKSIEPTSITFDQAVEMLEEKRKNPKKKWGKKKEA